MSLYRVRAGFDAAVPLVHGLVERAAAEVLVLQVLQDAHSATKHAD